MCFFFIPLAIINPTEPGDRRRGRGCSWNQCFHSTGLTTGDTRVPQKNKSWSINYYLNITYICITSPPRINTVKKPKTRGYFACWHFINYYENAMRLLYSQMMYGTPKVWFEGFHRFNTWFYRNEVTGESWRIK